MNLRVDLILPSESRSASTITLRGIARMMILVVPIAILSVVVTVIFKYQIAQRELAYVQMSWDKIQAEYKTALQIQTNILSRKGILAELQGWRKSRIPWTAQLAGIQAIVPANVQLTDLRVDHSLQLVSNKACRILRVQMSGKTRDPGAEERVMNLMKSFTWNAAFSNLVKTVEIPSGSFGQDPDPKASRQDRVFQIRCEYIPKAFE